VSPTVSNRGARGIYIAMSVADKPQERVADPERKEIFERVAGAEVAYLYAVALTITRDPADAEDIVQDTVLAAWRSWSTLRDPSRPRPWLTRICVNRCLQHLRRSGTALRANARLDQSSASTDVFRFTGELLDFDRVFTRLSSRQRAVVALHYFHGYTVSECSGLMGCRPGTARSHLARAMATLKQEMRDE